MDLHRGYFDRFPNFRWVDDVPVGRIASRIPLLHGSADLILLALVAWALQKRVNTAWQWALIGGLALQSRISTSGRGDALGIPWHDQSGRVV
jgi:hypothetical protein